MKSWLDRFERACGEGVETLEKKQIHLYHIIAALICELEESYVQLEYDFSPEEHALQMWNQICGDQPKAHLGDCTNMPATCSRCVYDEYLERARKLGEK